MRKLFIIFFLVLLTNHILILAQTNLAGNGGFENGINDVWELLGDAANVSYSADYNSAIEGTNCLKAVISQLGANSWSIQIKNAFGPVTEGHLYRATIWAKAATGGSTINYTIGKATAGYDEYASTYGLALSTDWQQYTLEFTAQVSTSDDITLALHITGIDTYWFDDFRVIEVVDEISQAVVRSTGDRIVLTFNMNLTDPGPEDQLPFFVYSDEDSYPVSEVTPHTESDKLNLYLQTPVPAGENITVEYIPGVLLSSAGTEIQAFSIVAVNNSEYIPPVEGLENLAYSDWSVYPTLVRDRVMITSRRNEAGFRIRLLSVSGITILDEESSGGSKELDISRLKQGLYLVLIESEYTTHGIYKIIKQ